MKYRTKLYLALVGVALAAIILGLSIFSTQAEKLFFSMLQSQTLSIAATATENLDIDLFSKIGKNTSMDSPEYLKAKSVLQRILNANQRNDIYFSDVYTIYRVGDEIYYGVDIEFTPLKPGTPYLESDRDLLLKNWELDNVNSSLVTDLDGVWLSAYSPYKDEEGKIAGILGVDINATDIQAKTVQLLKFGAWGLSSSLLLALGFAFFLSKQVSSSLRTLSRVVGEIANGNYEARANLKTQDEFSKLGKQINLMAQGLQDREKLKLGFARYVSSHVLETILESEASLNLGGERKKVTLLFSDIRQFTHLTETLAPEEIVRLLNEYFEQMIEVIFTHSGTLDKFMGDGIMVEFGAPLDDEKQEENAVRTAIAMQSALEKLCTKWESEGKPQINMGIGVHTGEAVVGNIGSEKRISYTAIGDAVNVAARLKQATKVLKTPILISESTYLACKNLFPFRDLGLLSVPGRKEQIHVYSVD